MLSFALRRFLAHARGPPRAHDGPPCAPGAAGARPDHDADLGDDGGAVPAAALASPTTAATAAAFALPGTTGTQFNTL